MWLPLSRQIRVEGVVRQVLRRPLVADPQPPAERIPEGALADHQAQLPQLSGVGQQSEGRVSDELEGADHRAPSLPKPAHSPDRIDSPGRRAAPERSQE